MDITSLKFLVLFLPVFTVLYIVARRELRLVLIVIASVVFLVWGQPVALLWLSLIVVTAYALGRLLASDAGRGRALWLWTGVGLNLAVLAFFKLYTAYGARLLASPMTPDGLRQPLGGLVVPLGISYVTFQAISYLVDVRRGTIPAERNVLRFAAYLFFFPKLVSGPLVRYGAFAAQLDGLDPSAGEMAAGLRRLFLGFIKRTLIANQAALIAGAVFDQPQANVGPGFAWLALLAYTLQIYFDFAGYTDMAIGLGAMSGIRLPENFNNPYLARSLSDFWRRWHISLTTWFREYVFYPLERRRLPWAGQQINILIVFLLTGLWHGFRPHFIAWGLLHGLALALESLGFGRWLSRRWRPLQHLYALAVILAGWVLFRSDTLGFALTFFRRLAGDTGGLTPMRFIETNPLPFVDPSVVLALALGVVFVILPAFREGRQAQAGPADGWRPLLLRAAGDAALIGLFVLGLASSLSQSFLPNIYASF